MIEKHATISYLEIEEEKEDFSREILKLKDKFQWSVLLFHFPYQTTNSSPWLFDNQQHLLKPLNVLNKTFEWEFSELFVCKQVKIRD